MGHRSYRRFLAGITATNIGQFLQGLASPFLVKELTDSNGWVGAVSFASLIPALFATPIAGILADRLDRRTILLVAYSAQTIVTAGFVVLHAAGELTAWRILILSLLSGTAAGFQWAPVQSMAAVLVPSSHLVPAVRLVSISFTAGRALGPMIAGIILHVSGPGAAFVGTLITYLVGLSFLFTVRTGWTPTTDDTPGFVSQFRDGIGYVRSRPPLRLAVSLSFLVASLGAVFTFALTPSIADDIFETGGGGLGALATMAGVGSIAGSFIISGRGGAVRRSRMELGALTVYIGGLVVVAATTSLAVGLAGFFFLGLAHMLHGVTVNTAVQVQVHEEYRGRVMSVWLMAVLAGLPIGAFIGGFLADAFSIATVMLVYAGVMAGAIVVRAIQTDWLAPLDLDQPIGSDTR
ncbi:MAG: MFS transporter [Acidimicrobiales bacterium]